MTKKEFSNLKIGQSVYLVDFHEKRMREEVVTDIIKCSGPGYPDVVYTTTGNKTSFLRMRHEISVSREASRQKARQDAEKMILDYSRQIEDARRKIDNLYLLLNGVLAKKEEGNRGACN